MKRQPALRVQNMGGGSRLHLWKLERGGDKIRHAEVKLDAQGWPLMHIGTEASAKAWAKDHPGWRLTNG